MLTLYTDSYTDSNGDKLCDDETDEGENDEEDGAQIAVIARHMKTKCSPEQQNWLDYSNNETKEAMEKDKFKFFPILSSCFLCIQMFWLIVGSQVLGHFYNLVFTVGTWVYFYSLVGH